MKKTIALLISLVYVLIAAAPIVCADDYSIAFVTGNIYDIGTGTGIEGATVYATCLNNSNVYGPVLSGTNGTYDIVFECPVNTTINVNATKDYIGSDSSNGTLEFFECINFGGTQVDVGIAHIDVGIPEFPAAILPVLLTIFSMGIIRTRRNPGAHL